MSRAVTASGRTPGAWRVALACLAASCLAVWHISLLWLYRDTPWVMSGCLLAVFALVWISRGLARRAAPERRTGLMRAFARLDATGFLFVAFLLILLLVFHLGFERAASDGRSYFVLLRSAVMDHDFNLANDEAQFGGVGAAKYPIGAPMLWSPFYLLGHVWLKGLNLLGGNWRAEGYIYPYQRAIGLASLLYGFVGLVLVYRVLRRYFARNLATLSTLGICTTSFLVWYLTVDNSMVHGVSMFATTQCLFLWHRFRQGPERRHWLWLGAAAGIMTAVRWQDGVFAVLPVADWLWTSWRARTGGYGTRLRAIGLDIAAFGVAGLVVFLPQLVFWKAVFGSWVYLPTREHGFGPGWIPPFMVDVLVSSNRGLLSWTPVVTFSLVGLLLFARRHGRVALVLAAGVLGQVWVNGAVEIWWGGVGFGARRFSNSILVFAVGLASLLSAFQRFPLAAPAVGLAALLTFNTVFMLGYRDGTLTPTEGVTFEEVMHQLYERVGNPLSLPVGAYVAWRYDVGLAVYDRLRGRTYNNLDIDVGGPEDNRFLGHGWSGREQAPAYSFRWSDATTSTVLVPLKSNQDDYVIELEWGAFQAPGLPTQVVSIEVNGITVASLPVQPGLHTDRVGVPSRALAPHLNQVRFRYLHAKSPKEMGMSDDARPLAVAVSTIRFLRQVGAGRLAR